MINLLEPLAVTNGEGFQFFLLICSDAKHEYIKYKQTQWKLISTCGASSTESTMDENKIV